MSNAALCLKPINDLLKERFFIPSYQRGYRWSGRQVEDLLDDISEFQRASHSRGKEAFYCLQPVVVMKRQEGDWELIDGQQRLTTVFLILTFLLPWLGMLKKKRYSLHYETREGSGHFLEHFSRDDLSRSDENVDYFHLCAAFETIERWFAQKDGNQQLSLLQCLLNGEEDGKNVKIIWYELPQRDAHASPVDVFIRLNMGKIPLTNAELIRALFLSRGSATDAVTPRQLQIAQEWDNIEKMLQADEFWYFIHKGDVSYPTRIEYLFLLITQETPPADLDEDDPNYVFIAYYRRFLQANDAWGEWQSFKRHFMICEEWFADRQLYHLIGYLVTQGVGILELTRAAAHSATKTAFRSALKGQIGAILFGHALEEAADAEKLTQTIRERLRELSYEEDRDDIQAVLLLFNIATLLQNRTSNLRFPFDSYKKESWDIEHIRSIKSDRPERIDAQKTWLANVAEYWSGDFAPLPPTTARPTELELCTEAKALIAAPTFDRVKFDRLYERILRYFEEDDSSETDHSLSNLALLDAGTNRSYKNAVFPIKRRRILGLDKAGTFVPLCTTNAFLKYYSRKIDHMMFWTEEDRAAYFEAMVDTLAGFFGAGEEGAR